MSPKHPGGVFRAEARLTVMALWVDFVEIKNVKPGAVLQLVFGNAATCISASSRLTREWCPIKPLALIRLLESI